MRVVRILLVFIAASQLAFAGRPVLAQAVDSSANVRAVMKAEQAWWEGEIKGDTVPMARLMAPNFESFSAGQTSTNRGDLLRMIRPDTAGEHEDLSNWKVRDYGSTVVTTADYRVTQVGKLTRQTSFIDVWTRERNSWKLVFSANVDVPVHDSAK